MHGFSFSQKLTACRSKPARVCFQNGSMASKQKEGWSSWSRYQGSRSCFSFAAKTTRLFVSKPNRNSHAGLRRRFGARGISRREHVIELSKAYEASDRTAAGTDEVICEWMKAPRENDWEKY